MSLWIPHFLRSSPIFAPLLSVGSDLETLDDWPDHTHLEKLKNNLTRAITTCSGKFIHFVPQNTSTYVFSQQYEPRIYLTGEIQTRTRNWHDLFNTLVWLSFPRTKATLNQLHYHELLRENQANIKLRGRLRDAATLFDESGVVVVTNDHCLAKLLRDFDWKELFWWQRKKLQNRMQFFIFGHGLYEKGLNPYLGMTGKGIILTVNNDFFGRALMSQLAIMDVMLVNFINSHLTTSVEMVPVPILGYPGWSSENMDESFYDNQSYFRPRSLNKKTMNRYLLQK